ncbi:MAG: SDR family oxidoreductase [Acidimicrobiales bacterium]|nr:SDR family oxidoreductase [Acidimicrobiales bacterium]
MRVAVIGATGYVGGRLVPQLLAAGHTVRCLARTPGRLDGVPWRNDVEVVAADVMDRPTLDDAFAGIDAVYYLVHALGQSADFEATDRLGARNTSAAAAAAGVSRIVYLGGLGEDDPAKLSAHLASRHEVGQVLADGPVPVTELRAAVIIGSGSVSFEMLRHLVEVLPAMICPRWVTTTRCQPIAIADVLHHLVAVLGQPETAGRIFEIGGPDVLTYRQMMERYAAAAGLKRRIIVPVNVLSPRLSSHWINLVTPLPYRLARPLVDSLVNDVVVHPDRDIRTVVDHEPLPFDEALRRALTRVHDLDVATAWTDSSARRSPAAPMPQDPDWAGGTVYEDRQRVRSTAPAADVFAAVSGVGGARGWYVGRPLWAMRGWLDKMIGGVGMRRGRRHPDRLRVGDALDFFRVEAYEPPRLLRLRAEMKVPGDAWLEWRVEDIDGATELVQYARFHPRGVAGRLYWWTLLPIHAVIWRGLAERLVAEAEQRGPTKPAGGRAP